MIVLSQHGAQAAHAMPQRHTRMRRQEPVGGGDAAVELAAIAFTSTRSNSVSWPAIPLTLLRSFGGQAAGHTDEAKFNFENRTPGGVAKEVQPITTRSNQILLAPCPRPAHYLSKRIACESAPGGKYVAGPPSGPVARFVPCRLGSGRLRDHRGRCPLLEAGCGSVFFAILVKHSHCDRHPASTSRFST